MKEIERLLAKSSTSPNHPRGEETLRGHTAMVLAAAEELLNACGTKSLNAAGLDSSLEHRLRRTVLLGSFVHDLGKCSDHFQLMVRRIRTVPQLVRHEALSLWLSWFGRPLSTWLRSTVDSDVDYGIAIIAAAGHHRKFWTHALAADDAGAGTKLTLLTSHSDFHETLRLGAKKLGLEAPSTFSSNLELLVTRRSDPRLDFQVWEDEAKQLIASRSSDARLLSLCKALVLAADVAGSALPREGERSRWIRDQLAIRPDAEDLRRIVRNRLNGKALRPFQINVAQSRAPLTLVAAGCGTGKTLAAYQWAADQHPGRQLWITYPTTGTATEGFRDYLDKVDIVSRLEHSRAEIDLEILGLDQETDQDRLQALRVWGTEVVSCTVDTVLGLIQNHRKGIYAWPSLSHGAIVFDEIHAYDDVLFSCLIRFLESLPGIPCLLMTASLPANRLSALRDLSQRVHGRSLEEISGPEDLETFPRYRIAWIEDAWSAVSEKLQEGGKVLWIRNTVDQCIATAESAMERGWSTYIYHSRFRYRDRVHRHHETINAFRAPGVTLAVTTQVAEMSLDLSADLLVTDLAPVPSIIQRMGRLNRRATPEEPRPVCDCLMQNWDGLPYEKQEIHEAREWVDSLLGKPLSQRDLVEAWLPKQSTTPPIFSEWLDGWFQTTAQVPVREASPGIVVILESDADAVRQHVKRAVEVALPMNRPPGKPDDWRKWPVVDYYPVPPAQAITYDPNKGAKWHA